MNSQPAAIIGLISSIVVAIVTQVLQSGLVTNASGINLLGVLLSAVPFLASLLIGMLTKSPAQVAALTASAHEAGRAAAVREMSKTKTAMKPAHA